jgi:energy-coupling factor transport system permease protein
LSLFFQYEERDTFFHNLHPTTKITVFICTAILASLWWDLRYLAILLIILLVELTIAGVPKSWAKGVGIVSILAVPVLLPTAVLSTNSLIFHVLPQKFASTPVWIIVSAKASPTHLPIGFTYGNLYWMFSFEVRVLAILFSAMVFVYTTSSSELVQWLLRRGVPYPVGYVVMVALKFIPILIEDTKRIIWAQKLRGWEITSRNPAHVVQQISPIAIPMTGRVLRLIDDTELSAASRAFGYTKGVSILSAKSSSRDYVISISAFILTVVALFALVAFNMGSI